jgi:hypothetical protein
LCIFSRDINAVNIVFKGKSFVRFNYFVLFEFIGQSVTFTSVAGIKESHQKKTQKAD